MRCFKRSVAVLLTGWSLASSAWADDITVNEAFSPAASTRFPTPLPSNGQATVFTTFSGSAVPFIMRTFFVSQSGTVTATLSGLSNMNSPVAVGAYFLTGTFSPNSMGDPTTRRSETSSWVSRVSRARRSSRT